MRVEVDLTEKRDIVEDFRKDLVQDFKDIEQKLSELYDKIYEEEITQGQLKDEINSIIKHISEVSDEKASILEDDIEYELDSVEIVEVYEDVEDLLSKIEKSYPDEINEYINQCLSADGVSGYIEIISLEDLKKLKVMDKGKTFKIKGI